LNGHEGFIGEAGVTYGQPFDILGQPIITPIGPSIKVVDATYNKAFFGVDAEQSAQSGLDEFDPDGGVLSYGVDGALILPLTDHVSTMLFGSYERLADDAADSSLVEDRGSPNQGTLVVFLNYEF
jgi:outer membrane protein